MNLLKIIYLKSSLEVSSNLVRIFVLEQYKEYAVKRFFDDFETPYLRIHWNTRGVSKTRAASVEKCFFNG